MLVLSGCASLPDDPDAGVTPTVTGRADAVDRSTGDESIRPGPADSVGRSAGDESTASGPADTVGRAVGDKSTPTGPADTIVRVAGDESTPTGPADTIVRSAGDESTPSGPADTVVRAAGDESIRPGPADTVDRSVGDESTGATDTDDPAPLLDRTRDVVHGVVLGTAQRVDNIFGAADIDETAHVSQGQAAVGAQWDQRDGLAERLRLKARFALPAIEERLSLIIGRGDAQDIVDGTNDENIDTLPERFNDYQDEDWLVGVGYSHDQALRRGWDFGAGIRVTSPVEPYLRATYHWNRSLGERALWRVRPRAFWQSQRGFGLSLRSTLDIATTDDSLLRFWSIFVTDQEEVEGLSWTTKLIAYQYLSKKSAASYAVYGSGETSADVSLQNYGAEFRLRRQISRDWLFMELLTSVNWPRERLDERRELNLGVGIEFEMQFGDWPGRPHR